MGLEFTRVEQGLAETRLEIQAHHLAPNGFLHAGTVVTLADSTAGFGASASLPEGAIGFTTVDLSCNFLGTSTDGVILARGVMVHSGRTTQLWDVTVRREDREKPMALFRCTQLVLYPR
ncbi:MAG: PaaI family thioesterase, partial [Candidatus Dormibacteria bacterium]